MFFHLGPRPDNAHLAGEHVQKLRQFIKLERAEPAADAGNAWVVSASRRASFLFCVRPHRAELEDTEWPAVPADAYAAIDRKSTRLNSSHQIISYAVFCLK